MAANVIPSFYPANVVEILQYGLLALALSRHSEMWIAVKCINEVVEQTTSVDVDLEGFEPDLPPIAATPLPGKETMSRRFILALATLSAPAAALWAADVNGHEDVEANAADAVITRQWRTV